MLPILRSFLVLCVVAAVAGAQQPNTGTASAVWGGVDGPPWPISVAVPTVGTLSFVVSGVPNQPFTLVQAPAGLTPGFWNTPYGLVDMNLSGGFVFVVDGIAGNSFLDNFANTGSTGTSSWNLNLSGMSAGYLGGLQVLIGDPSAPSGYRLTAATQITVHQFSTVYVSASTGAPGNPGTQAAPLSTIAAGIALAATLTPAWVHVASGTYVETPTFATAVSIRGGFDPATWTPSASPTIVQVSQEGAIASGALAVALESLTFQAANASGALVGGSGPSYYYSGAPSTAMRLQGGSDVIFTSCTFTAGSGVNGIPGTPGQAGAAGAAGATGSPGGPGSGGGEGGAGAGNGGDGGLGGYASASGEDGDPGTYYGAPAAAGGPGGAANTFCFSGGAGSPGQPGGAAIGNALNGAGGGGWLFGPGRWISMSGQDGTTPTQLLFGSGGGGGGGGAGHPTVTGLCFATRGAGGGGGGSSGGPGTHGTGGTGGGCSIGVSVVASSATFVDCTFNPGTAGHGGAGGAYGPGGAGGAGGPGGPAGSASGAGGSGGAGGAGAAGGGGGGGAGGMSVGVARLGSPNVTFVGTTTFNPGTPGAGGAPGWTINGGVNGLSQLMY
jgi:hypothetical protein